MSAAYRELEEETGITRRDISLIHFIDFTYHWYGIRLEFYIGRLNSDIPVHGDENDLLWISLDSDFFDISTFAGEGNIGHMMLLVEMEKEKIFK